MKRLKKKGNLKVKGRGSKKAAKRKFYKTKLWKRLVIASLIIMIITIILDVFYRVEMEASGMLILMDGIDVPVTLVLLSDVTLRLNDAKDKKKFVKKNLVLIFSVLPISFALIGFRLLRIFPVLTELPLLSELVALEKVVKMQHGAKFIEAMKAFVRSR